MTAIKREERIGGQRLILGDCLEVMPLLGPVDAYITDPPYEGEAHAKTRRSRLNGVATRDPLDFAAIDENTRRAVAAYAAQCSGWSLTFCQAEAVTLWRDALVGAGAKYKRAMVWCKPDSAPQFNGQGPAQGYESIVAAWCGRGAARWNGGGRRGFFIHPQGVGRFGGHKTEKPVALMKELVELFTNNAATILDPFLGSGTTLVACQNLGRAGIGIEIDPDYFEIACKRVDEAARQPDMFIAPAPKPKQTDIFQQEAAE